MGYAAGGLPGGMRQGAGSVILKLYSKVNSTRPAPCLWQGAADLIAPRIPPGQAGLRDSFLDAWVVGWLLACLLACWRACFNGWLIGWLVDWWRNCLDVWLVGWLVAPSAFFVRLTELGRCGF